jgi:hypothetical protein
MGTGEGAAILMAILRGSGRLYYPATDASFWVPLRLVREVPPDALPADSLESFLSGLLLSLGAEECVAERTAGGMGLSIEVAGVTRATATRLERELGERLRDIEIVPASMRSVTLKLELGSLPPAAGAGR